LALALLEHPAKGAPTPWPAARLEYEYGYLSQNNTYAGHLATNTQAVAYSLDHRESAPARGLRGTLGVVIVTPNVAIFPRLSIADVQTGDTHWMLPGQLGSYEVRLQNQLWCIDVGAEAQLWRRIILVETAFGTGFGHSNFTLPAMETDRHPTQTKGGLLIHLATGLRAPLRFPLTFGAKMSADTVLWFASYDQWFVSAPSQRATLSAFVEFDPFYNERRP